VSVKVYFVSREGEAVRLQAADECLKGLKSLAKRGYSDVDGSLLMQE
jgi:hypothetical protein